MLFRSPRSILLLCAALDLAGLICLLLLQLIVRQLPLASQLFWIGAIATGYTGLSWLFGTYSLLSWRRIKMAVLVRRQLAVVVGMLVLVALSSWILNTPDDVWLIWRTSQLQWLLPSGVWSIGMRLALRRGLLQPEEPRLLLVAPEKEAQQILSEWRRTPSRQPLIWMQPNQAMLEKGPVLLAVSTFLQQQCLSNPWLTEFQERDPRQFVLTTPVVLAERQLERLPPHLLPEPWLSYDSIPWSDPMRVQRQLKRVEDVFFSGCLLVITSPLLLLSILLIWINDRKSVFYSQQRSGWLGQRFKVWKLRTMTVAPLEAPASWTVPGDQRITRVGQWLRRSRIDELPQLFNVLRGEMSLIGPRPERPELEMQLEANIPHYRKRHWMRPGLSGWAQVNAPYASTVEDSELKVSYDLFYIKNFSTWLDLVILMRTLKTVLKLAGQ